MTKSGPEYAIEIGRPEHIAHLPAIERAAAALFPAGALPPGAENDATPVATLEAALTQGMLWVSVSDTGVVVGFAVATWVDGLPHLSEMSVHPEHGRRGLGRRMVDALCEWAVLHGHAAVTLTTFRDLAWNAPFYARLGFRELADTALTPGLRAILAAEVARGFDAAQRVAMRRALG